VVNSLLSFACLFLQVGFKINELYPKYEKDAKIEKYVKYAVYTGFQGVSIVYAYMK